MLNSPLLRKYMSEFYGYGELSADYWFIGMEEGGGTTEREIRQRLNRWQDLGGGPVVDIAQFHRAIDDANGESMSYFFEGQPEIQKTWRGLIWLFLASKGQENNSAEVVRSVQAASWGRRGSDTCLLELLPLPSPGVDAWHYDKWSELPELCSRIRYTSHMADARALRLRALVQKHRPQCVVFYGVKRKYVDQWSKIAEVDFSAIAPTGVCVGNQGQSFQATFCSTGDTEFLVTYHPVYRGLTKEYFTRVGQIVRERIA